MLRYIRFLKKYRAFYYAFYIYLGYFSSFEVRPNSHFRINNSTTRTRHVMKAAGLLKTLRRVCAHLYVCAYVYDRQRRNIRSHTVLRKKWLELELIVFNRYCWRWIHFYIFDNKFIGFTSINCDFLSLILNKTENILLWHKWISFVRGETNESIF